MAIFRAIRSLFAEQPSPVPQQPSTDPASMVLRQMYEHWRHIENLREGFTTIWGAVVVAVLAFVGDTEKAFGNRAFAPAIAGLILVSLLGLFMTLRLNHNIGVCEGKIREILTHQGLQQFDPTVGWGQGWTRHISLRRVFLLLYISVVVVLVALLGLTLFESELLEGEPSQTVIVTEASPTPRSSP